MPAPARSDAGTAAQLILCRPGDEQRCRAKDVAHQLGGHGSVRAGVDSDKRSSDMGWLRSNADLAVMGVALGTTALVYACGLFVIALALHPVGQHGWRPVEMVAVAVYPLGWIGLGWLGSVVWNHRRSQRTHR